MTSWYPSLSKSQQATLYAVRAVQVGEDVNPKAVEVVEAVDDDPYADVSPSTVHASLSNLVDEGLLERVDADDVDRGYRYAFAHADVVTVLEEVVEYRAGQLGIASNRGGSQ